MEKQYRSAVLRELITKVESPEPITESYVMPSKDRVVAAVKELCTAIAFESGLDVVTGEVAIIDGDKHIEEIADNIIAKISVLECE